MTAIDRQKLDAAQFLRSGASDQVNGLHRGRIESIDDPDRLGRVRVRVWSIHRDKTVTPTTSLPWAEVSEPGSGGYDYGGFDPPPVGSTVWVGFEGGYVDHPVILGGWRGIPKRDLDNPNVMLTNDGQPATEKPWLPPDEGLETPKDIFEDIFDGEPHPTRRVWRKSYKGHTILIEDGDDKEFLRIIDRAGQVISMECPVEQTVSEGNGAQRGARNVLRGDQLPHAAMKNRRASIRIVDLSGQEIFLDARDNDERIVIRSKSRSGGGANSIELRSGRGKELIQIEGSDGSFFRIDPNSQQTIRLQDGQGNAIYTDKEAGQVRLSATKETVEEVPRKSVTVQGTSAEEVRGDKVTQIQGNLDLKVVNDLISGVMGTANAAIGGALKLVVNNAAPSGVETDALDVSVTAGNINISNLLGNIKLSSTTTGDVDLSATLGDAILSTVTGNATLETVTGNVEASTTTGNASLKTSAGIANVDGTTVHLGPVAAAIQPVMKGLVLSSGWTAALTDLGIAVGTAGASVSGPPTPINNQAAIVSLVGALTAYITALGITIPQSLSTKSFTA